MTRQIHGKDFPFIVERPHSNCAHACTVDDVAHVLRHLPAQHVAGEHAALAGVIMRQPSRRERARAPAWGRLIYAFDIGPIHGPVIILEAVSFPLHLKWPRTGLSLSDHDELSQLLKESTAVSETRRDFILTFDLVAVRAVQLYRTLLHEVGHLVHYGQQVEAPADQPGANWQRISQQFWSRPRADRECFAERYAREWRKALVSDSILPFEPIVPPVDCGANASEPVATAPPRTRPCDGR